MTVAERIRFCEVAEATLGYSLPKINFNKTD